MQETEEYDCLARPRCKLKWLYLVNIVQPFVALFVVTGVVVSCHRDGGFIMVRHTVLFVLLKVLRLRNVIAMCVCAHPSVLTLYFLIFCSTFLHQTCCEEFYCYLCYFKIILVMEL